MVEFIVLTILRNGSSNNEKTQVYKTDESTSALIDRQALELFRLLLLTRDHVERWRLSWLVLAQGTQLVV